MTAGDEHVIYVDPSRILEVLAWLKREPDHHYDYLSDLTAVDFGGGRPLQVVYQLFSIPHRQALRLKAELPLSDLVIDSAVPLWEAANWLEREVYDMFGITFRGHPDLRAHPDARRLRGRPSAPQGLSVARPLLQGGTDPPGPLPGARRLLHPGGVRDCREGEADVPWQETGEESAPPAGGDPRQ